MKQKKVIVNLNEDTYRQVKQALREKLRDSRSIEAESGHVDDEALPSNVRKVWCDGCNEMEDNDCFNCPDYQCQNCKYPIPKVQGLNGSCPRCRSEIFEKYEEMLS